MLERQQVTTSCAMFRSKKKKTGNATRKRKDLDEEDENEVQSVEVTNTEAMEVDDGEKVASNEPISAGNEHQQPTQTDPGDEDDEAVVLERMRSRMQKVKGSGNGAMSFSSKVGSVKKTRRVVMEDDEDDGAVAAVAAPVGSLSFEDDAVKSSAKKSKLRIRPNLSVSHVPEEAEEEEANANLYSRDMMSALLREQKVLMRRTVPSEAVEPPTEDVDMEVDAETERLVREAVDEEMKGEEEDASAEEFIPLNAKLLKTKKNKKRVTFGVQDEDFYPPKSAEVEEAVTASEGEEGDDEEVGQSKRWEEELMRRGGGHHVQYQAPKAAQSRGYAAKSTYPTRKAVPCASLGEVMRSIQKKINTGSFDRDRVARELARLDAETELIQKKLAEQRDELLVCSEQFEYFQVVEDFVKGLSFCLREKLPEIESEERTRTSAQLASTEALCKQRTDDVTNEIRELIQEGNTLQRRHFTNFPVLSLEANSHGDDPVARLSRFSRGYQSSPAVGSASPEWDVFADTVDDFSSLSNVYGRFQEWKAKFPDVYKNAYCNLALSKLYAPYIRAEIVDWDPLHIAGISKPTQHCPQRVSDMMWFKTLRLHQSHPNADLEEPLPSILREIIVARVADATKNRLDPFSSDHVQSVIDFIEDLTQLNAIKYVEHGLEEVVANVLKKFTDEAKQFPILAINEEEAKNPRVREFATFLVGEFCSLLVNALTFFVALPSGSLHLQGFNAVMLILHQLLAYVNHCQHEHKTAMLPQVSSTIQQLSASSFMQSILARSTREQYEFQRVLHLLSSSVTGKSAT